MASSIKKRKSSNYPKLLIVVLALVLLVAGGIVALKYLHKSPAPSANDTSIYDEPLTNNDTPNKSNPDGTPTQAEENSNAAASAGDSSDISGVLNSAFVSNGNLVIRTTINNALTDGTCTLTLTRSADGKVVTKTANVVANPASATCAGFDVPVAELGSGSWTVSIKVVSGSLSGTITGTASL